MTVEELTQITTANTVAISEVTKAQAENNKAIAQLTNALLTLHESVKSLADTTEAVVASVAEHDKKIDQLLKEWQAYLTRQKRT